MVSQIEIKDALWDSYFDVETVVQHFLEEGEKRKLSAKKKSW